MDNFEVLAASCHHAAGPGAAHTCLHACVLYVKCASFLQLDLHVVMSWHTKG